MQRIIAKRTLREYWERHPDCEQHLKTWYETAKKSNWENSNDVKKVYRNASVVGNNRIGFNIRGNNYRLIVKFNFERSLAFIRFIGTHEEYDKIDAKSV